MEQFDAFEKQQRENMHNMSSRDREAYSVNADGSRDLETFTSPPQQNFDSPEMQGSMQQMLSKNIGEYVVIEFLIGTERMMRKQGILYHVGTSYVTLFDDMIRNFIVCDIFSVKFVYFYLPNDRPRYNYNTLPKQNGSETASSGTRRPY